MKEIKDASIKIAVDSVKKIITTSVDKSKLDAVFQKNLEETKEELKKLTHNTVTIFSEKTINYKNEFYSYWIWIWWNCSNKTKS